MTGLPGIHDKLRLHGPVMQRASAIAASLFDTAAIDFRDAADHTPGKPRRRRVSLSRGNMPGIVREGASHTSVTYAAPVNETSLAMILAAMAGPEDPIAANPEIHDQAGGIDDLIESMASHGEWFPNIAFFEESGAQRIVQAILDGAIDYIA